MPRPSGFVSHVVETMRALGPVEARAMFGGWGLYHQGAFFALILDVALYFKADDESRAEFERRGLERCVYAMKGGETLTLSYYAAPEEALEDAEVMARWARLGYAAALRAAKAKRPRRAKPAPRRSR